MTTGIDLHTHSTFSDGTDTPTQLIALAAEAGLRVLALTDHDSTAGWDEAAAAAASHGIKLVRGEEVSCRRDGLTIHVLSYLHDPTAPRLREEAERARILRRTRAQQIVAKLGEDYAVTWSDVLEYGCGGASGADVATIGRPHIADTLVAKGIVRTRDEAFESLMSSRSKYYVPLHAIDPVAAVAAIREAGGVAVIAHPGRDGKAVPLALLDEMVAAGLQGIEVEHRENSPTHREILRNYALEHELIITGSSDFHGETGKPNRLGENSTHENQLERVLAAATSGLTLL